MTLPFISVTDLSAFLKRTVEPSDMGAIVALDSACQTIRTYTGQHLNLVRGDVQEFRGFQVLLLPELPIIQVNSVTLDDELVADEDWFVGFGGILYVRDWKVRRWSNIWEDTVVVDYDHGYAITEGDVVEDESGVPDVLRMPSDIRLIALRLAAGIYQSTGGGVTPGMRSESLGAYSYTRMDSALGTGLLSNTEKLILDKYVVKKVPVP